MGAHKLYLLDYAKNQIHPFDKNNGLQLTDMDASACIDSRNYFWLPGNTGYVKVDNSTFALNEEPSSVILQDYVLITSCRCLMKKIRY